MITHARVVSEPSSVEARLLIALAVCVRVSQQFPQFILSQLLTQLVDVGELIFQVLHNWHDAPAYVGHAL